MEDEPEYEVWREVWRVTEYRDGCVYKTEYVEDRWVPMGEHRDPNDKDLLYVSISTEKHQRLEETDRQKFIGIRRKAKPTNERETN